MKALVMRSTGSQYDVLTETGERLVCRARGKLRLKGYKETNPVAVGDWVEIDKAALLITEIHERKNHILRKSVKKTGHAHVLAANIDQAALVVTMVKPATSTGFIDRFLVTAEAYDIPQGLIFNKQDILDEESRELQEALILIYSDLKIPCLKITATTGNLDEVHELLRNKTTLIAGHSGVGKSSLLNRLSPEINQPVGEISEFHEKGMHTTTFAEMFRIDDKTFVIDTPGIKEWGLVNITAEELSDNFPEMRALRSECRFGYRCLHVHEPQCAVRDAVEQGKISISRYTSYLSMLEDEDNRR
ncbi:MAG: ribosome small subunit-dependent GTPase A [Cyclobacteriaceae bacterium]|nr:ribosome small subunit-dependent GTPase A [Cyclobacteriaceae bacterium]MCX7636775.1 ribosome small subunit-dependent GTPase A [Cyclobacteriaceae bacterium]MDW8330670.1 ribosome small subunit-dependent GTPase A [Cyclobacteriaceae bacterium]